MNANPFYVHLEGMDLAGKTTACEALLHALGSCCHIRHNSLSDDNSIYALADQLRRDGSMGAETLGHLYVAALAADLEKFTPPDANTIQDSTILLRSMAYHVVVGTKPVVESMQTMLPRHPRFTKSIVLTANLDTRRRRLEQRQRRQPSEVANDDLLVIRSPKKFLKMESVLIELAKDQFNALVVDTSDMTEAEVCQAILAQLPTSLPD